GAARLPGVPRPAVRVLHARVHYVDHRVPAGQSRPHRRRTPRRAVREPVPLHRLPGNHPRSEDCRRGRSALEMSTDTDPVTSFPGNAPAARWVGQRMPRTEDQRMITGHGRYVDDLSRPGMLHAAFVRSTVAKGRIVDLDVSEALQAPGVIAV